MFWLIQFMFEAMIVTRC